MSAKKSSSSEQSQWVVFTEENNLTSPDEVEKQPSFHRLRHPKTDEGAMFLFSEGNTKVSEVLKFEEEHRSWLVDQTVQQDGGVYITTPADPLFLLLPYLRKQTSKFMTLDQIVVDEDFPSCDLLCHCVIKQNVEHIADVKGADDIVAYRYSQDKTFTWLRRKVERLAGALEEKKKKSSAASKDDFLRHAHGMVSDYLPLDLGDELKEHLGIKAPVHEKPELQEPPSKRAKTEGGPLEDYSLQNNKKEDKKAVKLTTSQTKLSKVDKSGMKSMASFFAPKPKKAK